LKCNVHPPIKTSLEVHATMGGGVGQQEQKEREREKRGNLRLEGSDDIKCE
jgi:hypothetical protein